MDVKEFNPCTIIDIVLDYNFTYVVNLLTYSLGIDDFFQKEFYFPKRFKNFPYYHIKTIYTTLDV